MSRNRRTASVVLASFALTVPLLVVVAPIAAITATAAPQLPTLVVNEVDADGTPQDWIELKNTGAAPIDASGLVLKDDKDKDHYEIAAGTVIAAGGYASFDVADAFGLGKGGDSARLYLADGTTLIDTFTWVSNSSPGSWGRCADGTGDFVVNATKTKGAVNDCPASTPPPTTPPPTVADALAWPGSAEVTTASVKDYFGGNLSGLSYELGSAGNPDTLWAVRNGPGTLYRLQKSGADWVPASDNSWGAGKALHYADGTGDVDAEGVAQTSAGTFVSSERDNSNNKISRPAVLRYDTSSPAASLNASIEWNLVSDLPVVGPNLGLEGITFVPDSYLTSKAFVDETTNTAYDPSKYANHGDGLYFVGLEGTGSIYAFALDQTDGTKFTRIATIQSGFPSIMEVQYDAEKSAIWGVCDDTCGGQYALLDIASSGANAGHFAVTTVYNRPAGMGNFNNEGFVTAPQALCVNGAKPVLWADDGEDDGYSLREGTIDCTPATESTTPPTSPATGSDSSAAGAGGDTSGSSGQVGSLAATGSEPLAPAGAGLFALLAGTAAVAATSWVRRRRAAPRRS